MSTATEVWTPLVQSAAGRVWEPSGGFAVQVKKVAGRTVDLYQQAVNGQLDRHPAAGAASGASTPGSCWPTY